MTHTLMCDPYIKSVIKSLLSQKVSCILLKIRVRLKAVDVRWKADNRTKVADVDGLNWASGLREPREFVNRLLKGTLKKL